MLFLDSTFKAMKKRPLGGLTIAPLVFGGNVFGWTIDEKRSYELLDAFVDAGFNCIDTADSYSRWVPGHKGGESETIIGKWLKRTGNRKKVIIATKVGSDMGLGRPCLEKKYILQSVEGSLSRLQTEYIDLYQSHYDDLLTPVGETIEAYAQLIKEGKVRTIGTSNMSAKRLKESLKFSKDNSLPRYESLQPEYNLYSREKYEREYESICLQENIGVINYFALASGFLSGKYRSEKDFSKSARGSAMKNYLNERGLRILKALDEIASKYNSTPATISIAWLIARPGITAPIASATHIEQLQELIKAVQLKLDGQAIKELNEASAY
jgi:aryl-alcohol dehydrogenase-like predicted oxidoreductase